MLQIGAIVLAAGKSQRMGKDKIFSDFHGKPMICHTLETIVSSKLSGTVIVLGYKYHNALAYLNSLPIARDCYVTINPKYENGMASSIAVGMQAVPSDWDGVFLFLGDMPMIPTSVVQMMRTSLEEHFPDKKIVVPMYLGKRGHPVLFASSHFEELEHGIGDIGARALLAKYPDNILYLNVSCQHILTDIDTREDCIRWNIEKT